MQATEVIGRCSTGAESIWKLAPINLFCSLNRVEAVASERKSFFRKKEHRLQRPALYQPDPRCTAHRACDRQSRPFDPLDEPPYFPHRRSVSRKLGGFYGGPQRPYSWSIAPLCSISRTKRISINPCGSAVFARGSRAPAKSKMIWTAAGTAYGARGNCLSTKDS